MNIIGRLAIGATLAAFSLTTFAAQTITGQELKQRIDAGNPPLVIDVRTEQEFLEGRVPGARLIGLGDLSGYISSLAAAKDESVLVYCSNDACAKQAADTLEKAGFNKVLLLKDNYRGWMAAQ